MENNIKNRMSEEPRKRGRPTLLMQIEKQDRPPLEPIPGTPPMFRCNCCGGISPFGPTQTVRNSLYPVYRCQKCGTNHQVTKEFLSRCILKR